MADWNKILSKGNVEDRRGSPLAIGGGLGVAGIAITLLFNIISGQPIDVGSILSQLPQAINQPAANPKAFEGEDDYQRFTETVLGSTNDTWKQIFKQSGNEYNEPKLVLFRGATQSSCGGATSAVGPHYCPVDNTIYIDETFYDQLRTQFNAKGGDVAEAYVLAHEVGHHVQHQLGLLDSAGTNNEESVKAELQADCFAGVWANSIKDAGVFEPGEINEAIDAAAAVGDDRIQEKSQGRVSPETWTHGSSEQRVHWFNVGFDSGAPAKCDT